MLRSFVDWSARALKENHIRHCSNRSLAFVAKRCPNLQVLSIKSYPNVTNKSLCNIAYGCPMLKELDINYCNEISHKSLELIGSKCPNLRVLKRNLMNWIDRSQYHGVVPNEYLNTCPQDGDTEAAAIGKFMPHLEHLELQLSKLSASGIDSITKGCLNLEYLDLFGSTNLTT